MCERSLKCETCEILEKLGNSGRPRELRRETELGRHGAWIPEDWTLTRRSCRCADGQDIANPGPWARVHGEPQLTSPAPATSAASPLPPPPQRLAPSSCHPRAPSSRGASALLSAGR